MRYVEQVEIRVPAAEVWVVLADVQGWRKWTPSIELVRRREQHRPFGLGSEAWVKQPRLAGSIWLVTTFEPERSFVWQTEFPGLRTTAGHHLHPQADGGTRVTLELRQSGLLAPLAGLALGRLTRRYLAMEAAGLKSYCEGIRPIHT
ncbi:SRPBCC family protein [Kitasatospora sp. LaBMicrA B282]